MADTWYSCYEDGFSEHLTSEDASESAEKLLERVRDEATGKWHADAETVSWGRLEEHARASEVDGDFHLVATPDPRRDAVAEIERLRSALSAMTAEQDRLHDDILHLECQRNTMARRTEAVAVAGARLLRIAEADSPNLDFGDAESDLRDAVYEARKSLPGEERLSLTALLTTERDAALARIRELEAPPVVPRDYVVAGFTQFGRRQWMLRHAVTGATLATASGSDEGAVIDVTSPLNCYSDVLLPLIWAAEHDARPPHEADNDNNEGKVE